MTNLAYKVHGPDRCSNCNELHGEGVVGALCDDCESINEPLIEEQEEIQSNHLYRRQKDAKPKRLTAV